MPQAVNKVCQKGYSSYMFRIRGIPMVNRGCGISALRSNNNSKQLQCRGCENQCAIMRYTFNSENHYFSGNRCEKVFYNKGSHADKGINTYDKKLELLFDRSADIPQPLFTMPAAVSYLLNVEGSDNCT